jgi:hypothetical protein
MTRTRVASHSRERGSAMLVTLVLIASLLAGASVLVSMQLSSNRSTDLTRSGLTALYCAEAGLAAARPTIQANYAQWNATLATDPNGTGPQPAWLDNTAFSHDLDGDGIDDFHINIRDNDDEIAPLANDKANDSDLRVYVISTCDKFPDNPRQVMELAKFSPGGGACYNGAGGCDGNGNSN